MERIIETSETFGKIAAALVVARGNMGPLKKTAVNPHFNSKYANLEGLLEVAEPAMLAVGVLPLQAAGSDGATVCVETMFIHAESGEWIRSRLDLKPTKADPQGVGSAITYGRRYALQAMCGLAAEDDDGNAASKPARARLAAVPDNHTTKPANGAPGANNDAQRKLAMVLFGKLQFDAEGRYEFYESVAGYDAAGEPIRSWDAVCAAGKASAVLDALKAEVDKLEAAGV